MSDKMDNIEKMEKLTEEYRKNLAELDYIMTVCVIGQAGGGGPMHFFYCEDKENAAPMAWAAKNIIDISEKIAKDNGLI